MIIGIKEMIDHYFDGDRKKAAESAGIKSVYQLNNLVSQGAEVARLDNGHWIMITKTSKVFKPQKI